MHPILFEWGSFVLPTWHAAFLLGAFSAYVLINFIRQRHFPQITERDFGAIFIGGYIGGYFGARILSIVIEQPEVDTIGKFVVSVFELGPMTFYGGFIGAWIGGLLVAWRKGLNLPDATDLTILGGLLGLAIGRLGCFFNGDDYGKVFEVAAGEAAPIWAFVMPNFQDNLPRYPVQLLEAGWAFLIVIALVIGFGNIRRTFGAGLVTFLACDTYAVGRFLLEFFRGDDRGVLFSPLFSPSQWISLGVMMVGTMLLALLMVARKKKSPAR